MHATSKIQSFEDIYSSSACTLGFRGEALFCLSNLCGKLIVATRTEHEQLAQKMEFDRQGNLIMDTIQELPRKVGTTVAAVRLFETIPVRRLDMMRHLPQQRGRLIKLIESYAIFAVGVKIHLMDMLPNGAGHRESTLLTTAKTSKNLAQNISAIMGAKFFVSLAPIECSLNDVVDSNATAPHEWHLDGFVSAAGPQASPVTRSVQYFSINGRPVLLPKIGRLLNDLWQNSFGQPKKPSCILRFKLPPEEFDINVAPDKREVILPKEQKLLELIKQHCSELWSSQTKGMFTQNIIDQVVKASISCTSDSKGEDGECDRKNDEKEETKCFSPGRFQRRGAFSHDLSKAKLQHEVTCGRVMTPRRKSNGETSRETMISRPPAPATKRTVEESGSLLEEQKRPRVDTSDPASVSPISGHISFASPRDSHQLSVAEQQQWNKARSSFNRNSSRRTAEEEISLLRKTEPKNTVSPSQNNSSTDSLLKYGFQKLGYRAVKRVSNETQGQSTALAEVQEQREELGGVESDSTGTRGIRRVSAVGEISSAGHESSSRKRTRALTSPKEDSSDDEVDDGDQAKDSPPTIWRSFLGTEEVIELSQKHRLAAKERRRRIQAISQDQAGSMEVEETEGGRQPLTASITKEEFGHLTIIGQFNMGFILAKSRDNNLWIFDQHACDERFNFERLCSETVLHEQPLLAPLPLELSPTEEMCVMENLHVFEKNGFRFKFDGTKPPRHRLSLTSLPHSGAQDGRKAVQFGKDDVVALCAVLSGEDDVHLDGGGTGTDGSGMYSNNAVRRNAGGVLQGGDSADRIIARLPKAVAMFASRACRSSIMVGKALSESEMSKVISQLANLQNPWTCAHGRSTLNHVCDLNRLLARDEQELAEHMAGPTITILSQEDEPMEEVAT